MQNRMRVASPEWREPSRTAYLDRNDRNSVRVGGVTRHRSSGLFTIHGCVVQGQGESRVIASHFEVIDHRRERERDLPDEAAGTTFLAAFGGDPLCE